MFNAFMPTFIGILMFALIISFIIRISRFFMALRKEQKQILMELRQLAEEFKQTKQEFKNERSE